MVTANLPPFGTQGTRIDITVSAMGDAKACRWNPAGDPPARRRRQLYALARLGCDRGSPRGDAAKSRWRPDGRASRRRHHEREIDFALNRP